MLNHVIQKIQETTLPFSIQMDKSCDQAMYSQLLLFVIYFSENKNCSTEDFLFCVPLITSTKGADVYQLVNNFFTKNNINWKKISYSCCDGTPSMLGKTSGFVGLAKREFPQVKIVHCCLHQCFQTFFITAH